MQVINLMTSYEFVNVWPSDLTSMRVAYGDSNVLKCSVQFAMIDSSLLLITQMNKNKLSILQKVLLIQVMPL